MRLADLKAGGKVPAYLLGLTIAFMIVQNIVGTLGALLFGPIVRFLISGHNLSPPPRTFQNRSPQPQNQTLPSKTKSHKSASCRRSSGCMWPS